MRYKPSRQYIQSPILIMGFITTAELKSFHMAISVLQKAFENKCHQCKEGSLKQKNVKKTQKLNWT